MKTILFVTSLLLVFVDSQRPGYAGNPSAGYPQLANRFRINDTSSSTTLANRFGVGDVTTPKIPVDARGDQELVNRLNSWPKENRPFWILNSEAIEQHRETSGNTGLGSQTSAGQPDLANRGSFAGGISSTSSGTNQGQNNFQQYPQQQGGGFQQYPQPQGGGFQQQYPQQQGGGFQQQYPQQQGGGFQQQYPQQQGGGFQQQYPQQQGGGFQQQYPQQQGGGFQDNFSPYPMNQNGNGQQFGFANRVGEPEQGSALDPSLNSFADVADPNPPRTIRPPLRPGSFEG